MKSIKELEALIEPFIYKKLEEDFYEIYKTDAIELLTYNRLDLAFKLFFLEYKNKNFQYASHVYKEDIRCQTSEKYKEYGNKDKNSFDDYIEIFNAIYIDIKENGFNNKVSLVPLSNKNTIINASHRIATAIYLKKSVSSIRTNLPISSPDYIFYRERNVSSELLDVVVNKFIEYSQNTYIAFLWPSGKGYTDEAESCFSNVVYKKEIKLNSVGANNILFELYKHMDWIGNSKNNYFGIQKKVVECFPSFDSFKVVIFQSKSLEDVRDIKENVRKIYNIGFSSIHITDTQEEAIRISKLILNDNGLHFLNHASTKKYTNTYKKIEQFKEFVSMNNIDCDDVIIDSGLLLSAYGIREAKDIDYLLQDEVYIKNNIDNIDNHDDELIFHEVTKNDLLYNPRYYFWFNGVKFISFHQLYKMKSNRNSSKDLNDLRLMTGFVEKNFFKTFFAKIIQRILYLKIQTRNMLISILQVTGTYDFSKNVYDKYFRN